MSDLLSLFDVEVTSDLRQENTKGHYDNSPCVANHVPYVGCSFFYSDKLWTEIKRYAFEHGFRGEKVLVHGPVGLGIILAMLGLLIFLDDDLRAIDIVHTGREQVSNVDKALLQVVVYDIILDQFDLNVGNDKPEATRHNSHPEFNLIIDAVIWQCN